MDFKRFLNVKTVLLGSGIFAAILAILIFSGKVPLFNSASKQKLSGTVRVWGTIPSVTMSYFVDAFDKEAKSYNMEYTEVPYSEINRRLIQALADGYAPDLIIAPAEIAFANSNRIRPVSPTDISESNFRNMFADIASNLIEMPTGYLALPISVDPLVLYYNRDVLSSAGFYEPPKTWGDLYLYEDRITKINNGQFTMSTIAFGTYDNIPHISNIILAMVLQQGETITSKEYVADSTGNYFPRYIVNVDEINPNTGVSPLNSALSFTKDFADVQKPTYNWSARSSDALSQFIAGNLAFYIGYASEASYIKSANQKIYFDYTYLPQIEGAQTSTTFGNLYTIFMLRTSPTPNLAYPVMLSLATGPFSQNLVGVTGGISALKTNIGTSISSGDQLAEISGNSVLISKSFYDLHRSDLEVLMREAIRQVYNGEKSTVEASEAFSENLQAVYDGQN
ncbi:hypothetical protein SDC9_33262 [bioreactor metagenome]|uniref:Uncharacterized protein n=1 Tax=bioreactor metagenome TaxID=1076179 RepID=A0A644V924_9ZZZZ|nr:extracellular solute-binding protein [Candidatus Elulimicrobiales bacterium]